MIEFSLILAVLGVYCAPALIALWRRRSKTPMICLVNIALGWTIIGWIVAFAWALGIGAKRKQRQANTFDPYGGMAITTADRFNTHFFGACFGLVAATFLIIEGLSVVDRRHSPSAPLTDAENAHMTTVADQTAAISPLATPKPTKSTETPTETKHGRAARKAAQPHPAKSRHSRHSSSEMYVDGVKPAHHRHHRH